jgi:hypothetical protein
MRRATFITNAAAVGATARFMTNTIIGGKEHRDDVQVKLAVDKLDKANQENLMTDGPAKPKSSKIPFDEAHGSSQTRMSTTGTQPR